MEKKHQFCVMYQTLFYLLNEFCLSFKKKTTLVRGKMIIPLLKYLSDFSPEKKESMAFAFTLESYKGDGSKISIFEYFFLSDIL